MIGVNPPGHFLWDPKPTDALIGRYSRLCAQDPSCSKRTDDLAASIRKTTAHMPDRFWGLPIDRKGSARRLLLRPGGVDLRVGAALGADDLQLVALGRATATRAGCGSCRFWPSWRSPSRSSGASSRPSVGPTPARQSATSRRHTPQRLDPRQSGNRVSLRGRRSDRRLAGQPGRERLRRRPGLRGSRPCSSAARWTSPLRRSTRPGSCCPTSRTAVRSCWQNSVTRPRSGARSRRRALDSSMPFSTAARSTTRCTPRPGSTSRPRSRRRPSERVSPPRCWRCR